MTEQWRDVPGFEGRYQVSDQGRIWSQVSNRLLKPSVVDHGYPVVHLRPKKGSSRVHKLVMLAFRGPCPDGLEVRHLDGDPANARLTNLEYGTHAENHRDITRHNRRKLSVAQVHEIREAFKDRKHGFYTHTAKRYAVSVNTIRAVTCGELYGHV